MQAQQPQNRSGGVASHSHHPSKANQANPGFLLPLLSPIGKTLNPFGLHGK
jgi:hypothetical protein